jgi:hypothetical protein
LGVLAAVAFTTFGGDLAGVDGATAAALGVLACTAALGVEALGDLGVLACAAALVVEALGDFTGVALACALGDLRGVTFAAAGDLAATLLDFPGATFAAAGAARLTVLALEAARWGDFRADVGSAAAGDARLAEAGVFDTPPLTADLGVLTGEAFAAAGDLAATLLDFPGVTFAAALGDFTGALPFPAVSRAFRAAITSNTENNDCSGRLHLSHFSWTLFGGMVAPRVRLLLASALRPFAALAVRPAAAAPTALALCCSPQLPLV